MTEIKLRKNIVMCGIGYVHIVLLKHYDRENIYAAMHILYGHLS